MTILDARWINLDTGAEGVNDTTLSSGYTPVNYDNTPNFGVQADKFINHLKGIDDKLGLIVGGGVITQGYSTFTGQTIFVVAVGFSAGTYMEVYIDGFLQREGVAFNRDENTNQVIFTEGMSGSNYVEIKVAADGPVEFNFDVVAPQTVFTLASITDESNINVYIDGIKQRDGVSFVRNSANDTIIFSEPIPAGIWVFVKVT